MHPFLFALAIVMASTGCADSPMNNEDGSVDSESDAPDVIADFDSLVDVGEVVEPPAAECIQGISPIIEPIWIAGESGPSNELGTFGRPDAIFVDQNGIVLAGDEDSDYDELHLFELSSDDPTALADMLTPLADLGSNNAGGLQFKSISGFTQHSDTGLLYVAEQKSGHIQILKPTSDPFSPPFYEFHSTLGAFAQDKDFPEDGEFVRLQALRTDSLGNLFVSDDARDNAVTARRDVQVFSPSGEYLYKFGDNSYGPLGWDGNIKEPENFAIDEVRDRVYVCDEGEHEVVVFRYSDQSFIQRIEGFVGVPNGIDLDHLGYIYVVDEGLDGEGTTVRVLEPETYSETYRFTESSPSDDLTPGTLNSPDTLWIDIARDLLLIADQGHDRIQGFALSKIQSQACLRQIVVRAPPFAASGYSWSVHASLQGPNGEIDRSRALQTGRVQILSGAGDTLFDEELSFYYGIATATFWPEFVGDATLIVQLGGMETALSIQGGAPSVAHEVSGNLEAGDHVWSGSQEVWLLTDDLTIPEGSNLTIEPGAHVVISDNVNLIVHGDLHILGDHEGPIQVGPPSSDSLWGQIHIENASANTALRYVNFVGGGQVSGGWRFDQHRHCCTPMVYQHGGSFEVSYSAFLDSPNKGMLAVGTEAIVDRSTFMRLGFGAEFDSVKVNIQDTHVVEMRGVDDNDGLYVWGWSTYGLAEQSISGHWADVGAHGEDIRIERCVIGWGDDDGLDTRGSSPVIRDSIFTGWADKGISLSGGKPDIQNALIVENDIGMKIDWFGRPAAWHEIHDESEPFGPDLKGVTIADNAGKALWIDDRGGQDAAAVITPVFDECVFWENGQTLDTDFEPSLITVTNSVFPDLEGIESSGNSVSPPLFIGRVAAEFFMNPTAEGATLGGNGGPAGWTGF